MICVAVGSSTLIRMAVAVAVSLAFVAVATSGVGNAVLGEDSSFVWVRGRMVLTLGGRCCARECG